MDPALLLLEVPDRSDPIMSIDADANPVQVSKGSKQNPCLGHRPNIFRSEGTVVMFGLTKLYTKECKYTHNFSFSHWLGRGGDDGGGVGVRAGGIS